MSLLAVVLPLLLAADPVSDAAVRRKLLDTMLRVTDARERGQSLRIHGSIQEDELPYLFEATKSWMEGRRRNGAELLNLGRGEKARPFQEEALLETKDAVVWAILAADLIERDHALAGRRPEMIRTGVELLERSAVPRRPPRTGEKGKPLSREERRLVRTALRAGVLCRYPGLDDALRRALGSPDAAIRGVALDGLSGEMARALSSELTAELASERDEEAYVPLALALIRTADPKLYDAVDASLRKLEEEHDDLRSHFRNHLFVAGDPALDPFLWHEIRGRRSFYPEALDVLTTLVWASQRPPVPDLVRLCAETIESGNPSTDVFRFRTSQVSAAQESCELLISFLANGTNPVGDFDHRKRGRDAAAFARAWLLRGGQPARR